MTSHRSPLTRRPLADLFAAALLALLLLLGGCAAPLPAVQRMPSQALSDTGDTLLGRSLQPLNAAHPGLSGFHVFQEPHDAFAARVLLANTAERGIDAQYFLWHDDAVGVLLWAALWQAADRGARGRVGPAKVAGLHVKTYAVDGERIFVGSFNFDQRSAHLNTEMGLVIDAPSLAADVARVFDEYVYTGFYAVRLAPDGQGLRWIERDAAGQIVTHDVDPETTAWQRFEAGFLAGLPIDWLL